MRAGTWLPLKVEGDWNAALRDAFHGRSGAYAIRDRSTGTVLYVGESHCDRGWKTMLRHFQDPSGKFAKLGEWTHRAPERLEAAIWLTEKGDAATKKEAALIRRFKPAHNTNTNEIRAAECKSDLDFAFGHNAKKNPAPKSRNRKTGRYSFEGQWDRLCTCGHTLGHHTAEAPHVCIESDFADVDCSCEQFRPAKTKGCACKKNPSAPTPIGLYPREVDRARPAYARGYADAVMLHAKDLTAGLRNANIKFPPGSTRATAYVWGWWHAVATGATSARRNPESTYEKTHGGLSGDWTTKRVRVPDPKRGPLTVMGRLKRVEYETDKGEGAAIYFHDFGRKHANGEEHGRVIDDRKPWLVFNEDGLVIAGGAYVVRKEGIVG